MVSQRTKTTPKVDKAAAKESKAGAKGKAKAAEPKPRGKGKAKALDKVPADEESKANEEFVAECNEAASEEPMDTKELDDQPETSISMGADSAASAEDVSAPQPPANPTEETEAATAVMETGSEEPSKAIAVVEAPPTETTSSSTGSQGYMSRTFLD